jgi:capsular exopolysaccharide synthesis family protein
VVLSGSAPLAAIGRVEGKRNGRRGRPPLVLVHNPRTAAAEAFRILRTNLTFAMSRTDIRILVVTSASPGEGKTLVASNLAIALAQAGKRVLLVDADIRRPAIHSAFGIAMGRGLVDLIALARNTGKLSFLGTDVVPGVISSGVANLDVLPSGEPPDNPSELIGSTTTARLVQELGRLWDLVIIDTPPVGPVTDGQLMAAHADAVLTIVRSGKTPRAGLRGALEALRYTGKPILGIVLNDLRPGALSRYTTYGYYYSGYYGKSSPRPITSSTQEKDAA